MANVEALVNRAVHRGGVSAPAPAVEPATGVAPAFPTIAAAAGGAAVNSSAPNDGQPASAADRLSPDLKQKLLDADKQRDVKAKARARAALPAPSHSSAKTKFGGFTTGGNKYDPLNSAIQ
jgi:hypothetical protein